jgi:hypothetical protein
MSLNPLSELCLALLQVALIVVKPVTFCFTLHKAKPSIFYWEKEKFSDLDVCSISICRNGESLMELYLSHYLAIGSNGNVELVIN